MRNEIILLSQAILMTFSPFNYGSTALWQYKVTQALFILLHMLEIMAFFQRLHNSSGTIFTSIRSQLDVIIKPKFFQQKKGERIGHFVTMIQRCKIIYFSRLNLNSKQQKAFSYNSWKNLRYKLRLFKMLS